MICKLCLEDKANLQKKSHIIPEFMYEELFDEHHKMYKFSFKDKRIVARPPTGEYDKNILCFNCDRKKIGDGLEDYAKKLYSGGLPRSKTLEIKNYKNQYGSVFTQISKLDYTKYKLFLLSILWRASVSKREYFKSVSLGKYEDEVRGMIMDENPMTTEDYACMITTTRNDVEWSKQLFIEPTRFKEERGSIYRFMIGGMLYLYFIPKFFNRTLDYDSEKEFLLSDNNEIKIIHMDKGKGENWIKSFIGLNSSN